MAEADDPVELEPTLEETVAWSMDAEPELLPLIPSLFADLEEFGCKASEVVPMLRETGLGPDARVLDLGCGKGAAALAIAAEFGCTVHGVDGMQAFVEHAERRAEALGLAEQSIFAQTDVRVAVAESRDYDLVCLLALGDVFGRADETVAALRTCVKPGGYILIDDAFLAAEAAAPDDLFQCFGHGATLELLGASGDEIVAEVAIDGPDAREEYDAMTAAIARRAAELAKQHPADADLLMGYVARQQREVEILSGPVVGALWLLRRSGGDRGDRGDRGD